MKLSEKICDYGEVPVENCFFDTSKSEESIFFDSVNYDYNMAALPIFTADRTISDNVGKRYVFSENKSMIVTPSRIPGDISNKILQDFDERIYSTILRIAEYQKSAVVITDFLTLSKAAGADYNQAKRIKDSIQRLSRCSLVFNNVFYNNSDIPGTIKDLISEAEISLKLLSDAKIITVENWSDFANISDVPENVKKRIVEFIGNRTKLRTVLVLTVCDLFFRNI